MNFGLPDSTLFDRRVPKQKFYENLPITAALKRSFIDEIRTIYWRNKLAPGTLNLQPGAAVSEIQVFEIELTGSRLNEDVLRQMDSCLPYHLLFVLSNADRVSAWIGYKEATTADGKAFKVTRYYRTDWMPSESLRFTVDGLDMDAVYGSLVRQIAGVALQSEESLKDSVEHDAERTRIEKQIAALEKKARSERQPRRKFELAQCIRELERML